jgi:AcrR family transcriptional regulator
MKVTKPSINEPRRAYQQGARALAAEATGERIVDAFTAQLESRRFEDITLDEIAADAGVTRQTVIRRFGDKMGLMRAVSEHIGKSVRATRSSVVSDHPQHAVAMLVLDYEKTGDLLISVLAEEDRSPELSEILNIGRAGHASWVAETFSPHLAHLTPDARSLRLTQLQIVTDVWVWRILRRDQKRRVQDVELIINDLVKQLLA